MQICIFLILRGQNSYQAGSFRHVFNYESRSSNGNLPVKGDGKMGPKKVPQFFFGCAQLHGTRVAEVGSFSASAKIATQIFVRRIFPNFATNASLLPVSANLHIQFSIICMHRAHCFDPIKNTDTQSQSSKFFPTFVVKNIR